MRDANRRVDAAAGDQHDADAALERAADRGAVAGRDRLIRSEERSVEVEGDEVDGLRQAVNVFRYRVMRRSMRTTRMRGLPSRFDAHVPVRQRIERDARFRIGPVLLADDEAGRPVRGDRPLVVPRDLKLQPAEAFLAQNRDEGLQDAPAEAAPQARRIDDDPDFATGGDGVHAAQNQRGDDAIAFQPSERTALQRRSGEVRPQRVGVAAGEQRHVVVTKERVVVTPPAGHRVDVGAPHRAYRNDRPARNVLRNVRLLVRLLAATTIAFLTTAAIALAQSSDRCTHDVLTVDGTPIDATFCVSAPAAARVTVTETFTRGTQTFSRPLPIDLVSGATVTRAVDDVPMTEFASPKTLHLTVAYQNGAATLEHALLLPGAIVLK